MEALLKKTTSHVRYGQIEPLRGCAAVCVFLVHYSFSPAFQQAFPYLHGLLKRGNRVPMFFVISGYCLAAAAGRAVTRSESVGTFLKQRAWRLLPTFWLSIALILATHWAMVQLTIARTGELDVFLHGRFDRYEWFDWIKIATLTQIFDQRFGPHYCRFGAVNGAYWTLGIELQFSLIVALGLLKPRWFLPATALLALGSVTTYYHPSWKSSVCNTGLFLPFWSWFALGIAVQALLERGVTPQRLFGRHSRGASGLIVAACASAYVSAILRGQKVDLMVVAAGFAVVLWAGKALDLPDPARLAARPAILNMANQLLCRVGAMSYSIYLIHNQVSDCWRRLLSLGGIHDSIPVDLICVALTLVSCYAFYLVCEKPFVRGKPAQARTDANPSSASAPPTLLFPVKPGFSLARKAA